MKLLLLFTSKKLLLEIEKPLSYKRNLWLADVAELVDALDLGSSAARRGGSSPFIRTINVNNIITYLQ